MWVPEGKTEDGFETTLGVNHLGSIFLPRRQIALVARHTLYRLHRLLKRRM